MEILKTNIYVKITFIVVIGLLLLVPVTMIKNLIREREKTQQQAIQEVSSKWGETQTVSGPIISIPYFKYITQVDDKDKTTNVQEVKKYIHILPKELNITGEILPEKRNRGIYDIVVYNSQLNLSGTFDAIDVSDLNIPERDIQFDKAFLTMGIDDLRGIEQQVSLQWNGTKSYFTPGTVTKSNFVSGINVPVSINISEDENYSFSIDLELKGSQLLYFTPLGETTDVTISSTWNNPSFNGAFLPDTKEITGDGFKANWNILNLNRNYPQKWIGENIKLKNSSFGIDLLLPVDNYQKSMRSIKYAILFITFTFLVFFFVEVLKKVFMHPVQYILVGVALVVFYTLLLSISEHLNYNLSFGISVIATISLICGYAKAILKSSALAFLIGGILLVLYAFIFIIIQVQDYALLMGSLGIFIILGLVMYFTRKLDWYNLKIEDSK